MSFRGDASLADVTATLETESSSGKDALVCKQNLHCRYKPCFIIDVCMLKSF